MTRITAPVLITAAIAINNLLVFHDVYFIYKNEKAAEGQSLSVLTNIQFHADDKNLNNTLTMK